MACLRNGCQCYFGVVQDSAAAFHPAACVAADLGVDRVLGRVGRVIHRDTLLLPVLDANSLIGLSVPSRFNGKNHSVCSVRQIGPRRAAGVPGIRALHLPFGACGNNIHGQRALGQIASGIHRTAINPARLAGLAAVVIAGTTGLGLDHKRIALKGDAGFCERSAVMVKPSAQSARAIDAVAASTGVAAPAAGAGVATSPTPAGSAAVSKSRQFIGDRAVLARFPFSAGFAVTAQAFGCLVAPAASAAAGTSAFSATAAGIGVGIIAAANAAASSRMAASAISAISACTPPKTGAGNATHGLALRKNDVGERC